MLRTIGGKPTGRLRARVGTAVIGVGLLILTAACGGSSDGAEGGKSGPYLIGITDDMSGPVSAYGQAVQKVWTAYIKKVNAAGGINGRQLKLETLDDKSDTTTMVQNVRKLISDEAMVIDGSTLSTNCKAAAPVVTRAKVPMSCWAVSDELVGPDNKYIFSRTPLGQLSAKPMFQFAKNQVKSSAPRLTILGNTSGTCQAFAKEAARLAPGGGWTVAGNLSADLADGTDFTAQAAQVTASHADAFVYCVSGQGIIALPRRLKALGSNMIIESLSADQQGLMLLKDPKFYQLWHKEYTPPAPSGGEAKNYVDTLATQGIKDDRVNLDQVGQSYFAIAQIVASLKKCGADCTPEKLATKMQQTVINIKGVTGPSGYGYQFPDRQMPITSVAMFHYDPATDAPKQSGPAYNLGTE